MAAETFTAEQAARAVVDLRAAVGLEPQRFELADFVGMISDEIDQLRAAGKSDSSIASLVNGSTGANLTAEDLATFYVGPAERRHG